MVQLRMSPSSLIAAEPVPELPFGGTWLAPLRAAPMELPMIGWAAAGAAGMPGVDGMPGAAGAVGVDGTVGPVGVDGTGGVDIVGFDIDGTDIPLQPASTSA